jgi:hypothetical protein
VIRRWRWPITTVIRMTMGISMGMHMGMTTGICMRIRKRMPVSTCVLAFTRTPPWKVWPCATSPWRIAATRRFTT